MVTENPLVMNSNQAASTLGLSTSTLAKMRLYGTGPQYAKLGRRVVYRRQDLDAWLQSHIRKNTTETGAVA